MVNDPLEMTLLGDEESDDPEFVDYLQMLDSLPRVSRFRAPFEPLHTDERHNKDKTVIGGATES